MAVPEFHNRPNEFAETKDGNQVWLSRSCAVTAIVLAIVDEKQYVLLDKRGPGTPDFQGHWCLPCGYLDWDENAYDAARREIFEETGLDVDAHKFFCTREPWFVNTNPKNNDKQNISLHFFFAAYLEKLPEVSTENCEKDEVLGVKWYRINDAHKLDLAFHHNDMLLRADANGLIEAEVED